MQRLYRLFRFRQYNDSTPKLNWHFSFREEEIKHLNEIFSKCQKGEVQTVIIRQKQVSEELGDEVSNTDTKNQLNSIDGRGIGKTRLLTEWEHNLSSSRIKKVGVVNLINLRPKLQSGTYKISDLIIAQTQRFSTIWNREDITLLIKWFLSRLITVILMVWIGIVAVITFLASVFTITPVLGIPGEAIITFIMQNPLLITIAGLIALGLSFVAYQSGPLQKARKQWGKYLHPMKWRQIIADKGSPQQIADMFSRCLRRDLTYVFLIDDFDYLDLADYDVVLNISEMMKKNKFKGMFVISYNRDNPSLTESTNNYLASDLERSAPNKYFIDLPILTEEQVTTIVAKGFRDYNPVLVEEAVKISHWFFDYTNLTNALVKINGRCDLIFGFLEYLVDQGLVSVNQESSSFTFEVNDDNLVRLFEQFLSRSLEQYRKLLEYLQQLPKGSDCLVLLRWLLAFQRAKIKVDDLHAASKISRSNINNCLEILYRKGVIKEYRSGYCELYPEWRILLVHQWLDWNTDNIYTHQVFKYVLSLRNLVEQENIEEQALLANPCVEAIEILIQKATYLSDDLGYMQKSLRYFDAAFRHWKKLLSHNDENGANQQKIVRWQATTNYRPSINALSRDNLEQDVQPIVLCHTIALICMRLGDYKRAHEIVTEWLTIEHSLSDLSLTSTWTEIQHISQKLQILNARLLLREGNWSTAQKVVSSLKGSSIVDIAHTATSLELSLEYDMCFGLEHLARRFYAPQQMIDILHRLASAYLSTQTDSVSYAHGLQIDIRFALNDFLMAFMKQKKEADDFSFLETCNKLTNGLDRLLSSLKISKSRYGDFEFLRATIGIFETLIVLVNVCNLLLEAWLANPNNERISKLNINDIYKVLLQLTKNEMPRIRETLGSDFYQINQDTQSLISQFSVLDLNSIQINELATITRKVASELERVLNQSVSTMLEHIIRLAEHLGCHDNLPVLLTSRCMRRMQNLANLPTDSPERKGAIAEIASELHRALTIADKLGRVSGTEKTCVALGMIYDEFLLHYSRAAQYYSRAASICQRLGMPNIQVAFLFMHAATIYHNIVVIYPDQSETIPTYERQCLIQAREHFLLVTQEKEYAEKYNEQITSSIVKLDFELAVHYLKSQDFTEALFFADDTITRIGSPVSDKEKLQKGESLFLKARILLASNRIEEALDCFEQSYGIFKGHDTLREIQVLESLVDVTSPRFRLVAPKSQQQFLGLMLESMRQQPNLLPWIDWKSYFVNLSENDTTAGLLSAGILPMTFFQPHPVLDEKHGQYLALLSEKYNSILAVGIDHLSSEFHLELAQAAIILAIYAKFPNIKYLRDGFYLYARVGEAQKAFGVLKLFLYTLAIIPQRSFPHDDYTKDDFYKDATFLLHSLKENDEESIEVAGNVFSLVERVKAGHFTKPDAEKRESFIRAMGLLNSGKPEAAINILDSLVAKIYQDAKTSLPDEPKIPTDLDLSITNELYKLLLKMNFASEQIAAIDAMRHYLEAVRNSYNLFKLGQEYEKINPPVALKLYKLAFGTESETPYSQMARQRYYHLQEQLTAKPFEKNFSPQYVIEASPEYFVVVAQREGDNSFGSKQYEEAIKHYKKGLDVCIKTKDKHHQIYFLTQMGICFLTLKRFPEAIEIFNNCIQVCKESDYFTYYLAIAESNLGSAYSNQNQRIEAELHYQKALEAFQKVHDEKGVAFAQDRIQELSKSD